MNTLVSPTAVRRRPGFASRVLALARKELHHVRRDPVLPRMIVILPVVMLLLFGYALNSSVKDIRLGVVDASDDRVSGAITRAFARDDRFEVQRYPTLQAALDAARKGQVRAILDIPAGAQDTARDRAPVGFTLHLDGSDPTFAAQIRAAASAASQDVAGALAAARSLGGDAPSLPVRPEFRTLYNPDNRSAVYMVPGLSGVILTMITVMLTSIAIVRERETGTMEALIATPVRPFEVVLGKILPYLLFGLLDAALVLAIGHWLFGVPMAGSVWLLALAAVLFVLGCLGIGILISTVARTQTQAMFGTIAIILPSIFLSGFLLPLEGMNRFFSALSYLVPLRYYLSLARGVMLCGAGAADLALPLVALAVFAVLMLLLASLRFRKTL